MLKLRRAALGAVATLAVVALLAACSNSGGSNSAGSSGTGASTASGSGGQSIKLAGISSTASEPYYITIMCGATKEAKALGASINWKASNSSDTSAEEADYQAAMLLKPAGLIVATYAPGAFANQIRELMANGTPVVAADGTITPPTPLEYVASSGDVTEFVNLIAQSVSGTGKIGILGGVQGASWAKARWSPLKGLLPAGMSLLPALYSNLDRNQATTNASAMILAHPDLKAIYAVTASEGEGAAAAVRQAGKQGKVKVFAYGATPNEVAALKSGSIDALLSQPAGAIGAESVKALVASLKAKRAGKAIKQNDPYQNLLPLKVLTKANLNDVASQPYIYQTSCSS